MMCRAPELRPRNELGPLADDLAGIGDLVNAAVTALQCMGPVRCKLVVGRRKSAFRDELGLVALLLSLPDTCRHLLQRNTTQMLLGRPGLVYRAEFGFNCDGFFIQIDEIDPNQRLICRLDGADEEEVINMLTDVLVRFATLVKYLYPEVFMHPNFQKCLRSYHQAYEMVEQRKASFLQESAGKDLAG